MENIMKTRHLILNALFAAGISLTMAGCSDTWDEHYTPDGSTVNNNDVEIVDASLTQYLSEESSIASMYQLLEETGLIEQMNQREQLYTVLAVEGDTRVEETQTGEDEADSDKLYTAQSHVSDVAISPSNIKDGQRILMWNGKYLSISKTEDASGESIIKFNNATVTKTVKTNNGYVYYIDQLVEAPRSMYEMIEKLGDDYSIFREMVMARNVRTFDEFNSTIIGVDNTGNNVYDSVFVTKLPYFENEGFDITSENLTATMLIPSNEVINAAMEEARQKLADWDLEREDSVLQNWILQTMFYDKTYTKADIEGFASSEDTQDMRSVFGTQWRTTVQEIDLDNPVAMSNGTAYYVTKLKIPTNVLIFRLKDYYRYYEYLTDSEKNTYFQTVNLSYDQIRKSGNMSGLGWPQGGFPLITNYYVLSFALTDENVKSYELTFTPFKYEEDASSPSGHVTSAYNVPPGEYDLCLGFEQAKNGQLGAIDVYFNGELVKTISESETKGSKYHYDRSGQGYPEGFDVDQASKDGNSSAGKYDRDGTKIGTVTIEGTEAKPITLRFVGSGNALTNLWLYHWCLKPTKNCY